MRGFRDYLFLTEAVAAFRLLAEGRRNPDALRNAVRQQTLFGDEEEDYSQRPEFQGCPVTPLSSYDREISVIQKYAHANPENFAQVLLFSPLSANVNFAKHWDNFPVVMSVLRFLFPDGATPEQLKEAMAAFGDKYYSMGATIAGWKYDTISYVWNNREKLFHDLTQAAQDGSDVKLLSALVPIPGVAPVKAGFIAQLLFGRAGCIDTHNIDIYSKVFPDLEPELRADLWGKKASDKETEKGIQRYAGTLDKLRSRGLGTKELWDVWVDFVGYMYKAITDGGKGLYADLTPALNPKDPNYEALKTLVNKRKITSSGKKLNAIVPVPTIIGHSSGGGAGATHTIAAHDPLDSLTQFSKMDRGGEGEDWAKAVRRDLNPKTGLPYNKIMGPKPAMLHYFSAAIDPETGRIDPDRVKDIIRRRVAAARAAGLKEPEPDLFSGVDSYALG